MIKVKIKDIATYITSGITPLRSNIKFWNNGTIPWLKTEQLGQKEIFDTTEKITQQALNSTSIKLLPKNTLSIAMYGEGRTRGNISILKKEMTTNQACCNIVLDENKVDYEYIYYNLKTQYRNLRNISSGIRKNLNANDIKNFEILIYSEITTQQKIASILSSLDAKIDLNNRINAELEAMAKTLYDYWFVQFDFPISKEQARAMGKPELAGKPYKSSGGKMVYHPQLKREIPEGWEVKKLGEVVDCNKWSVDFNVIDFINYLDTSNLTNNKIDSISKFENNIDDIPSRAKRLVNKDDILFSTVRPNQCHYGIIKHPLKNMVASTGFAQIHSKVESIKNELIYLYLTDKNITQRLQRIADSSVSSYPSISPSDILSLYIPLPKNLIFFNQVNKKLNFIFTKSSLNNKENKLLQRLRDWLLPMLMNGQVKVEDVEETNLNMAAEPEGEYGR